MGTHCLARFRGLAGSLPGRVLLWLAVAGSGLRSGADAVPPLDVREFGAKGDGLADDTAAIQAAVAAAGGISAPYPGTAYYCEMREVRFPHGKYRITETLKIGNGRFSGEGAILEQSDADKDIFVSEGAWRLAIRGFTFLGGRNHLVLHNPNLDTGQILVEGCRFYGAGRVALDVDVVSTTLAVRDCIFLECRQVWLHRGCDQAVMRDCWITTAREMRDQAAIEHRGGRLTIENLCGVPLVNGADQRWIDNHGGNLTCRGVRFGGEGGGFTPIVNFARYGSVWGPSILVEDCFVAANGNARRNCVVFAEELPNQIEIRDCQLAGASLVEVRPGIDLGRYFEAPSPSVFHFAAAGNTGVKAGRLPAGLERPRVRPPPPRGLSQGATRKRLAEAVATVRPGAGEDAAGGEHNGHRQQTEPGRFVDLGPNTVRWHLDDVMDGTAERNAEHLAMRQVGTDVVLMRRTEARDTWPHVTIGEATVDLDRFPFLTYKQKTPGGGAPGTYAVRVLDVASGREVLLEENWHPPWDAYRAFDLRALLGEGGTRRLRIRYYYLGVEAAGKETRSARPGDYIVLDFLRAESR